jgi:opacity protein-like surface antigen
MFKRKILFFIVFLTIPLLSSCSLRKNDTKINQIENPKTPEKKKLSTLKEGEEIATVGKELNINQTIFKQNKSMGMKIENDQQVKSFENYRKNFYLNFSFGYSSLKNYDVYNTSTNEAIWDDRYTELGRSIEIGIGYDFGKIRTEVSYAQENGRFDEYLTYFDNSITKIQNDRGKLHKDFYLINTYYDFRDRKKFSPFIGLGIGFVNSVQDSAPFIPEYVRQSFVLQLKAGLNYELSDKNIFYIEGFKRDAKSHTTNDGLGTPYIYEAKDGFDSSGIQVGFRKII